jgi:hypothetical protein
MGFSTISDSRNLIFDDLTFGEEHTYHHMLIVISIIARMKPVDVMFTHFHIPWIIYMILRTIFLVVYLWVFVVGLYMIQCILSNIISLFVYLNHFHYSKFLAYKILQNRKRSDHINQINMNKHFWSLNIFISPRSLLRLYTYWLCWTIFDRLK